MNSLLSSHPALKSGLSRGYQAWEWVKRVASDPSLYSQMTTEQVFLSGDFENATDNLEHDVAFEIAKNFLERLGFWSKYLSSAFKILLSPRKVIDGSGI